MFCPEQWAAREFNTPSAIHISHTSGCFMLEGAEFRIKPDLIRQPEHCKPVSTNYLHSNVSVECQCIKSSIWEGWVPRKSYQAGKGWPWAGSRDMAGSQIHLLLGFPYPTQHCQETPVSTWGFAALDYSLGKYISYFFPIRNRGLFFFSGIVRGRKTVFWCAL